MHGPFDSDDGDVLTGWALAGRGIINKPRFEVEPFIRDRRLKVILADTPPTPVQLAAVYPHKKLQDPKVRLLLDFMAERCQRLIRDILAGKWLSAAVSVRFREFAHAADLHYMAVHGATPADAASRRFHHGRHLHQERPQVQRQERPRSSCSTPAWPTRSTSR